MGSKIIKSKDRYKVNLDIDEFENPLYWENENIGIEFSKKLKNENMSIDDFEKILRDTLKE